MPSLIPQCLDLARRLRLERADVVKRLSRAPIIERQELLAYVQAAIRELPPRKAKRKLLVQLVSALQEAESLHERSLEALKQAAKRSALENEVRGKLKKIAARHPNGAVIGGAQVQEYAAPPIDIVWATKKSRRG